ncbi:hypothetical protein ACUHGC_05375 [Testudinibacter sp. P27/CKL/0425]
MNEFKPLSSVEEIIQLIKDGLKEGGFLLRKQLGTGSYNGIEFEICQSPNGSMLFINPANDKTFILSAEALVKLAIFAGLFDEGEQNNG